MKIVLARHCKHDFVGRLPVLVLIASVLLLSALARLELTHAVIIHRSWRVELLQVCGSTRVLLGCGPSAVGIIQHGTLIECVA